MRLTKKQSVRIFPYLGAVVSVAFIMLGGSGKKTMSAPELYSGPPPKVNADTSEVATADSVATVKTEGSSKPLIELLLGDKYIPNTPAGTDTGDSSLDSADNYSAQDNDGTPGTFYSTADTDDSASAVDDDIWRQFDLAEEY